MASNEVEVLDPAATVEKLKKFASERVLNRRHFIAALGVAGAAAGTELVSGPAAFAQQPNQTGYSQVDVLNFLLNVKYLKATLYSYLTQGADLPPASQVTVGTGGVYNAPAKITFKASGTASAQQISDLFNEMYYDELNQLIALRALLGSAVAPRQTINMLGTGPNGSVSGLSATTTLTQAQAIALAQFLEDLSASAFAGASVYLTGANLQFASQAMAADTFHSGALRLLSIQTGAGYNYTGSESYNFTAGSAGGTNVIYGFLSSSSVVQVGFQVTTTATNTITGDTNVNGGNGSASAIAAPSAIAYYGVPSNAGIPGVAIVTAVGTVPNTYSSGYATSLSSHHDNVLPDVPAATAANWAVGMPVYDSGSYFPNPGTYIAAITQNPSTGIAAGTYANNLYEGLYGGDYSVTMSSSSGGHTPGTIYVGTTAITLNSTFPSTPATANVPFTSGASFSGSTIGVVIVDPDAVVPVDIGSGVATTGPALNPPGGGTSPLYQGFFDTAGTTSSSANTPPGCIFARTFQQVLAVLYAYSTASTSTTQNYEGGFYPVGVTGNITSVT